MSSLKDLASLIMVPSLYKDGELHTVKPLADENIIVHPDATDNNDGVDGTTPSTSGNFTFSRGSNLAATRVDVNGLIEKGRENQILHSNAFNNSIYSKINISFTSGQSGYDGSNDAWKFECTNAGNPYAFQSQTITQIKTRSIYAKAGTQSTITFLWDSYNQNEFATFDLTNGTFTNAGCLADIEDVGNGWYRCSTTITDASNGYAFLISLANEVGGPTSVGDNIYIQDAQQEAGLVATDYIETGTSAAQSGILEDMPRLDYSGGASCPSLLLEPQRTNLALHSEYFGNSFWFKKDASVVDNSAISPEGVQNATKLVESTSSSTHYIRSGFMSTTDGSTLTTSLFVKAGERTEIALFEDGWNGHFVYADLVAESVTTSGIDADIESLENGWFRIYIIDVARPSTRWQIRLGKDGTTDYQGDGTSGIYIYGFQMENQASYPTSYIPTYGTSQTRSNDSCAATSVSDVIGQTDGTMFFDVNISRVVGNEAIGTINSGGYANHVTIQRIGNTIQFVRNSATQSGATIVTSATITAGRYKLAIAYKSGDTACFLNGAQVSTTQTQTFTNATLNAVKIGTDAIGALPISDSINQALLFKTRLTNAELAALTTI